MLNFYVSVSPDEAIDLIDKQVINGSITGEKIDEYVSDMGNGTKLVVSVYEKHYYRAGNRLTLTVISDNLRGKTHIHTISGGGGQGLLRFDWGASGSFEDTVMDALYKYVIE